MVRPGQLAISALRSFISNNNTFTNQVGLIQEAKTSYQVPAHDSVFVELRLCIDVGLNKVFVGFLSGMRCKGLCG